MSENLTQETQDPAARQREETLLMLRATGTHGVTDSASLKDRISLYLTYLFKSQYKCAQINSLSRRFTLPARRLGLNFREVFEEMVAAGTLFAAKNTAGRAVAYNQDLIDFANTGKDSDLVLQNLLDNAE